MAESIAHRGKTLATLTKRREKTLAKRLQNAGKTLAKRLAAHNLSLCSEF